MTRGFSIYLDAVRVFAALVVLASHLAYPWASGGSILWIRELNLGSDFVIVFFVLSGVVIAHTTTVKDKTLAAYAAARLSRLYSVAVPAIVVSLAAYAVAARYPGADIPARDLVSEAVAAITFTNYLWFGETRLYFNGPYWSVAYEFWYYALFGAWTFLNGRARAIALGAIILVVGPPILLLLPCWLAGVWVYRRLISSTGAAPLSLARAWTWTLLPPAVYGLCLALEVPFYLHGFTALALGVASPYAMLHFSNEFVWNGLVALLVAAHFCGVARLIGDAAPSAFAASIVRWWSGRTFSLYLFHMPILKLIAAHPVYDAADPLHMAGCATLTIGACLALAEATERRLGWWRARAAQLTRHAASRRASPAAVK